MRGTSVKLPRRPSGFARKRENRMQLALPYYRTTSTDLLDSLKKLREKLKQQREHLDELEKHIMTLEGESKGEH